MSLDDESVLEKKEASTVSLQCLELCCVRRVTGLHGAAGQPPCSLSWRRGRLLPTPNVLYNLLRYYSLFSSSNYILISLNFTHPCHPILFSSVIYCSFVVDCSAVILKSFFTAHVWTFSKIFALVKHIAVVYFLSVSCGGLSGCFNRLPDSFWWYVLQIWWYILIHRRNLIVPPSSSLVTFRRMCSQLKK